MSKGVTVKIDRSEFDRTLKVYRQLTKRDAATICNTKGFYICRRATVETPKSTRAKIRSDLLAEGRLPAPIAALIVNVKQRTQGQRGLYGSAMKAAINALIQSRKLATLAAGWIPAIKAFEPYAEKRGVPRMAPQAKQIGAGEGSGKPAREGWKVKAVFENHASAIWDSQDKAGSIATPALQRAFDAEEASMKQYVERKLKESAHEAGIKTK